MAKRLDKSDIVSLNTIRPYHVSQSVDAFTGTDAYDINISGSFQVTGSTILSGSVTMKTLTNTAQTDVLTYNSSTGRVYYTASNAFGAPLDTGSFFKQNGNAFGTTAVLGTNDNNALRFETNATTKVHIGADGNVGINTTSPTGKLTVSGSGGYLTYDDTNSAGNLLQLRGSSDELPRADVSVPSGSETVGITYGVRGNTEASYPQYGKIDDSFLCASTYSNGLNIINLGGGDKEDYIRIYSGRDANGNIPDIHIQGSGSTRGYVGVNTSNPTSNLHVSGSLASGRGVLTTGLFSHAEGYQTIASGAYSHAEGTGSIAEQWYTHAEGRNTIARGIYSHAEGRDTLSSGASSHTEGYLTTASGDYSHAEGYLNISEGNYSHAEGRQTLASGSYSHAEGKETTTIGFSSHAEGSGSIASGDYSHAEGHITNAEGFASHAEGKQTLAYGAYSHAEGSSSIARGDVSHAEGRFTTASGDYSHAEGQDTNAEGYASHAEGKETHTIGFSSHAEGSGCIAYGDVSHAEGRETFASGSYSHAEGFYTTASGVASHADGKYTWAKGDLSHAEGQYTVAHGDSSHAEGTYTIASGSYSHAEGSGSIAYGFGSNASGRETQAIGSYSYAGGINTIASGSPQHVVGKYNTQGDDTSLFIVGNGDSLTLRDAFKVTSNNSIMVPTASTAPAWTGVEGEIKPVFTGGNYYLYVYIGGNWMRTALTLAP